MKSATEIKESIRDCGTVLDEAPDGMRVLIGWKYGELRVIASWGGDWDHVSVSRADRIPIWQEMAFIKQLFFRDDECAMQLHPAEKDYVNLHEHCLHLWRPQRMGIPQPPLVMV